MTGQAPELEASVRADAARRRLAGSAGISIVLARVGLLAMLSAAAVVALYLAKSAMGIDLMQGPSPLHSLLYPLLPRS